LALFNTFQAFPGFLLATERGLEMDDYAALGPAIVATPAAGGPAATLGAAWKSVIETAVEDVGVGLHRLADAGVDTPDVGYEYADEGNVVIAEAELAWPRSKVCVLLERQVEFSDTWAAVGWRSILLSHDWPEIVLQMLNKGSENAS